MRHFLIIAIVIPCAVSGCSSVRQAARESAAVVPAASAVPVPLLQSIVIDAGHGGEDSGAHYFGLAEKDLALDIAKRLKTILEAKGVAVMMTRERDEFIPLSQRAAVANRLDADLFLSIHLNANTRHWVNGIEVYYPRESVVMDGIDFPPFVKPSEVGISSTSVKQLMWDMTLRNTRLQSENLAGELCHALSRELQAGCKDLPARYVVLRESWMPSVLVEVGYMSNRDESSLLGQTDYRQRAAQAIADGLTAYIQQGTRPEGAPQG